VLDPPPTLDGAEDGDGGVGGGQVLFLAEPAAVAAAVGAHIGVRLARSGPAPLAAATAGAGVVASAAAAPGAVLVAEVESTGGADDDDGGDGWSSTAVPLVTLVHAVEWAVAMLAAAPISGRTRGAGSCAGGAEGVDGGRVADAGADPAVAPALAGGAGLGLPVEVVGVVDAPAPLSAIVGADVAAVAAGGEGGGDEPPDAADVEADAAARLVDVLRELCFGRLGGLLLVPCLGRGGAGRGRRRWVKGWGGGAHPIHYRQQLGEGGGGTRPAPSPIVRTDNVCPANELGRQCCCQVIPPQEL